MIALTLWTLCNSEASHTHFLFSSPPLITSGSWKCPMANYDLWPILFLSCYCLPIRTKKRIDCEMHSLTVFLSAFIRGECLSLGLCSVTCPTTHGILFNWTLQTQYRPLLTVAGKATRNSANRHCSSWLGNTNGRHFNEQQLLSCINSRLTQLLITNINCVLWHIYQFLAVILDYLLDRVIPNAQSWLKREACHVTGADRWKYFKRFD